MYLPSRYRESIENYQKGNHLCVLWGLESYSCHVCLRHSATTHKEKIIDREEEKSGNESHHTPTP